jgi:hypothetical protein
MDSQTKSSNNVKQAIAAIKGIPVREDLEKLLEQNVLVVDFTKLDGDRRVMTCTLREDIKPKATKTDTISQAAVRKVSDAVVSVWDVNARGWRSFRYERVNSVDVVDEYEQSWYNSVDSTKD